MSVLRSVSVLFLGALLKKRGALKVSCACSGTRTQREDGTGLIEFLTLTCVERIISRPSGLQLYFMAVLSVDVSLRLRWRPNVRLA